MLPAKENLLKCLSGEVPDYVPIFTLGIPRHGMDYSPDAAIFPGIVNGQNKPGGGVDIWGVEYVPTESTNGALMPKTSDFILDDITKWRDVIKAPSLDGIDWEKMYNDDMKKRNIDRSKTALAQALHLGYFQDLMSFMGFSEGLCAMYEEPEEVKALLEYLCDFYCEVAERYAEFCKPDIWDMADDTAAWANPFISADMYREFLIPLYDRQAKVGRDMGIPVSMHNCGKCEGIIDDLVGIGVTTWNPAQTCNDLAAIKARHGNNLVIIGGWDGRDHLLSPDVTYDELYESVKKQMDLLAPGGGYCFMGSFLVSEGDEVAKRKNEMLYKAVNELIYKYY